MDLAAIYKVIYDRAKADTASGGLFYSSSPLVTGIYNNSPPSSEVFPYLVYNVASSTAQNAFMRDIFRFQFRLSVFGAKASDASSVDDMLVGSNIIKRVYGDSTGGSAPSYGFHRWQPTLAGSWVSTVVMLTQSSEEHGDDFYQWVSTFEMWVNR